MAYLNCSIDSPNKSNTTVAASQSLPNISVHPPIPHLLIDTCQFREAFRSSPKILQSQDGYRSRWSNKALRFIPRFPIYFGVVVFSAKNSMDGFILCREVVKFKIRESLWTDPAGQMQQRLTDLKRLRLPSVFFFKNDTFKTGIRIHLRLHGYLYL